MAVTRIRGEIKILARGPPLHGFPDPCSGQKGAASREYFIGGISHCTIRNFYRQRIERTNAFLLLELRFSPRLEDNERVNACLNERSRPFT